MRRLHLSRRRVRQWSVVDEAGEVLYSAEYPYGPAAMVVLAAAPEARELRASECAFFISSSLGQPLDYVRKALDDEVTAIKGLLSILELFA